MQVKSGAYARVNSVEQRTTFQRPTKQRRFLQAAIGIQRHGSVEQQRAICHGVQAARVKEQCNVALQALRSQKRVHQAFHDRLFFVGHAVRISGINGGEVQVQHGVAGPFDFYISCLEINMMQQVSPGQVKIGIFSAMYVFSFELNNGNCFLDARNLMAQLGGVVACAFRDEQRAGVFAIHVVCEGSQRAQINAVRFL